MNLHEIHISDNIVAKVLLDTIILQKEPLNKYDIKTNSKNKIIFDDCEMRFAFVVDVDGDKLITLGMGSNPFGNHSIEVSFDGETKYIWCDDIHKIDLTYEWGIYLPSKKRFKTDSNNNVIRKTFDVTQVNSLKLSDDKIKEIHDEYNKVKSKQNSPLDKSAKINVINIRR